MLFILGISSSTENASGNKGMGYEDGWYSKFNCKVQLEKCVKYQVKKIIYIQLKIKNLLPY